MKIIIDKLDAPPPHALTRREVEALLAVIPRDWDPPSRVHLKATLPHHSRFQRPVIYSGYSSRLNVCCRGLSRQQAYRDILRELAVQGLSKTTHYGHRLSQAETAEIDRVVQPLLDRLVAVHLEGSEASPLESRDTFAVHHLLEARGYTWDEAYQIVKAVEEEKRHPTSRDKASRIKRTQEALREAGVDPETMQPLETPDL